MHTGNFHVTVPQQPDTMLPNKKPSRLHQEGFVPRTRFELARRFQHHHLKVACLPVSTPGHLNWVANLIDFIIQ